VRPSDTLFYTGITIIGLPLGIIIISIIIGIITSVDVPPKEKKVIQIEAPAPIPKIIHDTIWIERPTLKPKRKTASPDSLIIHPNIEPPLADTLK